MYSPERCVLIVARQIELRARVARVLQSEGYAVELANNEKRAVELVAAKQIGAAQRNDLAGPSNGRDPSARFL